MPSDRPGAPALFVPRAVRRLAHEVAIGDVIVGGRHPVAVQSMTTTRTADAAATAAQAAALARAGCAIVRVTVPSKPDAEALPEIRRRLAQAGVKVPLVADIHFTPSLALAVVELVEKVRVNPGNFADRKSLKGEPYDDARWDEDLRRVYELFAPLVDRAKARGTALRIGTNHGSLSDRIVHRFGDSPLGMVESALEFVRICEDRGFHDIVISMKASNPQVMVRAYRLLVERLDREHRPYPLHLGVTEAGGGDEGRIKSASGIATLLADGLGDTVRVSLTEDPVNEIPVARELVRQFTAPFETNSAPSPPLEVIERRDPLDPVRRPAARVEAGPIAFGGDEVPRVELLVPPGGAREAAALLALRPPVEAVDVPVADAATLDAAAAFLAQFPAGVLTRALTLRGPAAREAAAARRAAWASRVDRLTLVVDDGEDLAGPAAVGGGLPVALLLRCDGPPDGPAGAAIARFASAVAGLAPGVMAGLELGPGGAPIESYRLLAACLDRAGSRAPIVLSDRPAAADEDLRVGVAGRLGSLLLDGIGDAVRMPAGPDPAATAKLLHDVLQAARRRLERADYIACPSCGRTLFELEETTERVRQLTAHLKLKIAVMGCVVNGPGEMADADFGYVGWGAGKVALFVGRDLVERDVPSAEAPQKLVDLIRAKGRWTDPEPGP
ncbi:MAG: (E)-4-hydroxy-3-methylbut-2-enyl-diphosphate synthase [Acidobacteria bacterium]|jgi:(E)-4-hydroxy-3-methylbut-2-enyl-diphosphate synthase|nr:(E)-4-hydroxy-3-methylbut-2-enyl-diphosphate synthase [Acidobacteriota bacterium]